MLKFSFEEKIEDSLEGRGGFLFNVVSKGEYFFRSILPLHEFFTGLVYSEEKTINLLTKNEGNFSLSEIFDFAIKRVQLTKLFFCKIIYQQKIVTSKVCKCKFYSCRYWNSVNLLKSCFTSGSFFIAGFFVHFLCFSSFEENQ